MIKKTYRWMVLIGGVLNEPEARGPHYDKTELNGYEGGFDSIEEAEAQLIKWDKDSDYTDSYLLITEYQVINI